MRNQSGQAVLIVLLSMVVVLTVVLSIISSSTSDLGISTSEGASLRAFSAAESGIEQALVTNANTTGPVNSGASYDAVVTSLAQSKTSYVYPTDVTNGDAATFWFVSHDASGDLTCGGGYGCFTGRYINLCWGAEGTNPNTATTPAVEATMFFLNTPGNYTTTRAGKIVIDPNASRRSSNSYVAPDSGTCTIGTKTFAFQKKLDMDDNAGFNMGSGVYNTQNGLQFMLVKMIYNSDIKQPEGISVNYAGQGTLPSQGSLVDSTGTQGQATRRIEVTRAYNQLPPILDVAVFSPIGLVK